MQRVLVESLVERRMLELFCLLLRVRMQDRVYGHGVVNGGCSVHRGVYHRGQKVSLCFYEHPGTAKYTKFSPRILRHSYGVIYLVCPVYSSTV